MEKLEVIQEATEDFVNAAVDQQRLQNEKSDETPSAIIENGINNNMEGLGQGFIELCSIKSTAGEHPNGNLVGDADNQSKSKQRQKIADNWQSGRVAAELGNTPNNPIQVRYLKDFAPALGQWRSDAASTLLTFAPSLDSNKIHIEYKTYDSEHQMIHIIDLIQAELSEPYSLYTYRYFIHNWPKLCFLAAHKNEYVGVVVGKIDMKENGKHGYIAMLAVRKDFRRLKIGTELVTKAIEAMQAENVEEIVLETEITNLAALRLYENLGFVRERRLFRYYLSGVDAWSLKLWLK